MNKKTVLLGLSGGVDSAVAAMILKKKGYQVIGAFIKSFSETKDKVTGACSWREEYKEARKIAALLNIPLKLFDFEKEYQKLVVGPMISAYRRGITPNPDIVCNTRIKFPLLWKAAQKLKIEFIATGHHARIKKTKRGYELHQGIDRNKDQSYFLAELSQKELSHTLMPIGGLTKEMVRKIAEKNKFPNFNRQSSRGVCFIGNIPLKSFLETRIKPKKGVVRDENNQIIGTHRGAQYYTLGERVRPTTGIIVTKGALSQKRFFVARKNMRTNTIIVVPEHHRLLKKDDFLIKGVHWINEQEKTKHLRANVRIRHLGSFTPATLIKKAHHWQVRTKTPLEGAAPGQSTVFYQGTRLICSGEITSN